MHWTLTDDTGTLLTTEQAEGWLLRVLTNLALAERYWDDLRAMDAESKIRPPLQWLACINNRDQLVNSELWTLLSDSLKA